MRVVVSIALLLTLLIMIPPSMVLGADVETDGPSGNGRGLGDILWTMDIYSITGDPRHQGVEFDGTNFWVSGASDLTIAYLYEIAPGGTLINKYPQPQSNWGYWGWRDLAWDGQYLYGGDESGGHGYITQISTSNGQPTGTQYGPFPMVPCRALAWDPLNGCYWASSGGNYFLQCFLNNKYNSFSKKGLFIHSAAADASDPNHPYLWLISKGTGGDMAFEFDLKFFTFTGRSFKLKPSSKYPSGACIYDAGSGQWILVVCQSGYLVAYDLATEENLLKIDNKEIDMTTGGTVNFEITAGHEHAHRNYGLFGSASGSDPGILLPGGMVTLPINWDFLTNLFFKLNPPGFLGQLDSNGNASAALAVPPLHLPGDITVTFAYALQGKPWDFASNPVEVLLNHPDPPPPEFLYDDGSSESLLGWKDGGTMCWIHGFDMGPLAGEIKSISTVFGSPFDPGKSPGNGTSCMFYLWEDPNDDMDPSDAVLLDSVASTVQNVDTDIFNIVPLNAPQTVKGTFWIGCCLNHVFGQIVAPIDKDNTSYDYQAWIAGSPGGTFDPVISNNCYVYEMGSYGYAHYFLLRAQTK